MAIRFFLGINIAAAAGSEAEAKGLLRQFFSHTSWGKKEGAYKQEPERGTEGIRWDPNKE